MMPGMDPKQMQKLMKQMGIKNQEIDATKVTIELKEGGRLVIFEPNVIQIEMDGEKTFQIGGKLHEEKDAGEDDIKLVMESAGCSREEAMNALKDTGGDIAEAIIHLKGE